jgi:Rrf2 family transcriptional regulator, nitric oxide-sensitive transcriptional repressor
VCAEDTVQGWPAILDFYIRCVLAQPSRTLTKDNGGRGIRPPVALRRLSIWIFRQFEKDWPIRRVRLVVVWDGTAKFFPDTLNLSDALMQSVQMLLRPGLPVAERSGSDRQERSDEQGGIRDNGSAEKQEFVRSDHDYDISRNHLMKVAYELVVAGYVESVRGRGGGLRLAKRVEAIRLGEVIRKTEPDMALVPCLKPGHTSCALFPACVLRRAMKVASTAFLEALDGYTLGDLIQPGAKLRALVGLSQSGRDNGQLGSPKDLRHRTGHVSTAAVAKSPGSKSAQGQNATGCRVVALTGRGV